MNSKRLTKAQQDWQDWLRARGCVFCGEPAQIHHIRGASYRHGKALTGHSEHIGEWLVLPVCPTHHMGPHGLHGDCAAIDGHDSRRAAELWALGEIIDWRIDEWQPAPWPADIDAIIWDAMR